MHSNELSLDTVLGQRLDIVHEIYIHTEIITQILVSSEVHLAEKYHEHSRFGILDFWKLNNLVKDHPYGSWITLIGIIF